jgi:hypothetical protein
MTAIFVSWIQTTAALAGEIAWKTAKRRAGEFKPRPFQIAKEMSGSAMSTTNVQDIEPG